MEIQSEVKVESRLENEWSAEWLGSRLVLMANMECSGCLVVERRQAAILVAIVIHEVLSSMFHP